MNPNDDPAHPIPPYPLTECDGCATPTPYHGPTGLEDQLPMYLCPSCRAAYDNEMLARHLNSEALLDDARGERRADGADSADARRTPKETGAQRAKETQR